MLDWRTGTARCRRDTVDTIDYRWLGSRKCSRNSTWHNTAVVGRDIFAILPANDARMAGQSAVHSCRRVGPTLPHVPVPQEAFLFPLARSAAGSDQRADVQRIPLAWR